MHEARVRSGEGWLCACALLGLKRTTKLMERWQLTLEDTELMLRSMVHGDLLSAGGGKDENGYFMIYSSEDEGIKRLAPLFAQLGFSWSGFEDVIEREERKDAARRKKRGPLLQHKEFRSLRSWLLDEAGEGGEKIRVAMGLSNREDRSKRLKQLRRDSGIIRGAIELARESSLEVRRRFGQQKSQELSLAWHSLLQRDRQDEMLVNYEESLRQELERLQRQVEEAQRAGIEARRGVERVRRQLDFLTERRSSGKSGMKKRR